jgi:hypothetical protein
MQRGGQLIVQVRVHWIKQTLMEISSLKSKQNNEGQKNLLNTYEDMSCRQCHEVLEANFVSNSFSIKTIYHGKS